MADQSPEARENADVTRDRGSTTGAPRWVKVFGIIAFVLALVVVVVLLAVGGDHGPGRHTSGGGRGDTPSPSIAESGDAGGRAPE